MRFFILRNTENANGMHFVFVKVERLVNRKRMEERLKIAIDPQFTTIAPLN